MCYGIVEWTWLTSWFKQWKHLKQIDPMITRGFKENKIKRTERAKNRLLKSTGSSSGERYVCKFAIKSSV